MSQMELEAAPPSPDGGSASALDAALQNELLATDSLPAPVSETSHVWHNRPTLFPAEFCLGKVLSADDENPDQRATFVFKTEDEPMVIAWFENQKPALKKPRQARSFNGQRRIASLGIVPPGLIPGWTEPQFPPCNLTSYLVCQTVDLHGQRAPKSTRETHIEKEDASCPWKGRPR